MSETVDVMNLEPDTVLLGKYRVLETLGVGGMGVVVAAEHITLETRVAIKFLLPKLVSNPSVAERFVREARAAIRIQSDHVAKVIDVDQLPSGLPFMVMEYLDGDDLGELVERQSFPIDDAIDYIVQAAEAIARAHRKGIIHRDIKPANLFLISTPGEPDVVKVLDFGISKMVDEDDETNPMGLTKTTTVLGSGLYMSPEQMRSAKNVDFRTDVYAIGVCLYELLTGTHPYVAESFAELCVKVSTEEPTPIRDYRREVSDELAAVIAKAYACDPDDRYPSVVEFVAALAPFAPERSQSLIDAVLRAGGADDSLQIRALRISASAPPPPLSDPEPTTRRNAPQTTSATGALAATAPAVAPTKSRLPIAILAVAGVAGGVAVALWLRPPAATEPAGADSAAVTTPAISTAASTTTQAPATSSSSLATAAAAPDAAVSTATVTGATTTHVVVTTTAPVTTTVVPQTTTVAPTTKTGPCWGKDETGLRVQVPCP